MSTYFPSAAIDPAGDIGMTYLESSATSSGEYMSMYVTGKQLTDTTMQPASLVVAGNSALTGPDGSPHPPATSAGRSWTSTRRRRDELVLVRQRVRHWRRLGHRP